MPRYEYKLVPAPERAAKIKGLKGAASFAATLEALLNELGAEGWHYLRADALPQEERTGLASRTTTYRNILVFQRTVAEDPPEDPSEDRPAAAPTDAPRKTPVLKLRRDPRPAPLAAPATADDDGPDEPSLANLFADTEGDTDDTDAPKGGTPKP